MNKTMLVTAVVAGLVGLTAAAPTAQAFWGGEKVRKSSNSKLTPYERRYGQTFQQGFPEDCKMLSERAYLTNNAYWRYAAARCRQSRYSYH